MNRIQWEIRVPMFRNRFILQGLTLSIALPLGILAVVMVIAFAGKDLPDDLNDALILAAIFFVLTALLVLALYGGRYAPGFIVDPDGIINFTRVRRPRKNRLINTLLMLLGLLRGNLSAVEAGLTAQSRIVTVIPWKNVTYVRYYPKHRTILVRGESDEDLAVFCTKGNYAQVEQMVREHTAGR